MPLSAARLAATLAALLVAAMAPARLATGGGPAPAPARHVVLVELYTSQGCSSCPAADEHLGALAAGAAAPVACLAFHVDYWDDLGWKDPFAQPAFTARQGAYARAPSLRPAAEAAVAGGLYTPQMIVDGAVHFSGRQLEAAAEEIARAARLPARLQLSGRARLEAGRVEVRLRAGGRTGPGDAAVQVFAALTQRRAVTRVDAGENRGRTLRGFAIVRALSPPTPLAAAAREVALTLPAPPGLHAADLEVVLFAQERGPGPVLEALALPVTE